MKNNKHYYILPNGCCSACGSNNIGEDGPNWWCNNLINH